MFENLLKRQEVQREVCEKVNYIILFIWHSEDSIKSVPENSTQDQMPVWDINLWVWQLIQTLTNFLVLFILIFTPDIITGFLVKMMAWETVYKPLLNESRQYPLLWANCFLKEGNLVSQTRKWIILPIYKLILPFFWRSFLSFLSFYKLLFVIL